jgi:hypothetical protein
MLVPMDGLHPVKDIKLLDHITRIFLKDLKKPHHILMLF